MPTAKSDIAWLIELPQSYRPGEPPTYWGHVEEGEGWTRDNRQGEEGWEKYEPLAGAVIREAERLFALREGGNG